MIIGCPKRASAWELGEGWYPRPRMAALPKPKQRPGPDGGKRQRNREAKTKALVDAALPLFVEQGIESVTIDEIAKAAGMAKGNFYRYFADKAQLVEAILAPVARDVRRAMRKTAVALARADDAESLAAAYKGLAFELAAATLPRLEVARLYLQENRAPATPSRESIRALADELEEGAIQLTQVALEHELPGWTTLGSPRSRSSAAVEQLAITMLRGRLDAEPAAIAQIVVGMVLEGIASR